MNDHKQHWCSGSDGARCRHGHRHHGLACTPVSLAMAEEWIPACVHEDGIVTRASGRPIRPEWLKPRTDQQQQ